MPGSAATRVTRAAVNYSREARVRWCQVRSVRRSPLPVPGDWKCRAPWMRSPFPVIQRWAGGDGMGGTVAGRKRLVGRPLDEVGDADGKRELASRPAPTIPTIRKSGLRLVGAPFRADLGTAFLKPRLANSWQTPHSMRRLMHYPRTDSPVCPLPAFVGEATRRKRLSSERQADVPSPPSTHQ